MAEYLLNRLLCLFILLAVESCVVLLYQPLLIIHLSVCQAGEEDNRIACLFRLSKGYILLAAPFNCLCMGVVHVFLIERYAVKHDVMEAVFTLHQRPKGDIAVICICIIPCCNGYARSGYSWYKIAIPFLPILYIRDSRLRYFAGSIMHKRRHYHILHRLWEMLFSKL